MTSPPYLVVSRALYTKKSISILLYMTETSLTDLLLAAPESHNLINLNTTPYNRFDQRC